MSILCASTVLTAHAKEPLEEVVDALIKNHEEITTIQYNGQKPKIAVDEKSKPQDVARYDIDTKTIFLHPRYEHMDVAPIITNITNQEIPHQLKQLREILSHELGHFITDIYLERESNEQWLSELFSEKRNPTLDDTDAYIIIEGIGEYFGHLYTKGGPVFATERWNAEFDITEFDSSNFRTWLAYMGGRDVVEPIMSEDAHKGLQWLLQNELIITIPDLKPVPKYKQNGIVEVIKVPKLKDELMKYQREITNHNQEAYRTLLASGAEIEFIADIEPSHLSLMAHGIKSGRFPLELFKNYELLTIEYSAQKGREDPHFKKGTKWYQLHINQRLTQKRHVFRDNTDYSEVSDQIFQIHDRYILSLIKQHIDLYESDKPWELIEPMFDDPLQRESGGFTLANDEGLKLIEIPNEKTGWDSDEITSYSSIPADYYVQAIGSFHIHHQKGKPTNYSGPSGKTKVTSGLVSKSDILACRMYSRMNPFNIETVISEVGEQEYNVDLYFIDVENINGKVVKKPFVTVLDIGTYSRDKKE